jgi:alginate O-acetyltransferase complex protein AlgJ
MQNASPKDTDVRVGSNGWLYLVGGANQTIKFYTSTDHFSDSTAKQWVRLIRKRALRAWWLGCDYVHLVAPDKLSIYPECYPGDLPHQNRAPGRFVETKIKNSSIFRFQKEIYIDPTNSMIEKKTAEEKLFWKTDSHWTFEGAYVAYELLCKRFGIQPNQKLKNIDRQTVEIVLDLGSKCSPPVSEAFGHRYMNPFLNRFWTNDLVAYKESSGLENEPGLHVGSAVAWRSMAPDADPRKVLIFGDSFCEYREILLAAMIATSFAETHFVWSTSVDWSYVKKLRPDILITETTERFMNILPNDRFNVEKFSAKQAASHRNK